MARKASTTAECFIPSEGILEEVLDHNLEELFGKRATYIDAPTEDGWLVQNCSRIPRDPVKKLKHDTVLVETVRAQERHRSAAAASKNSTKPHKEPFSHAGTETTDARLSLRTDDNRNQSEDLLHERVVSRPLEISAAERSHPERHSSITGRHVDPRALQTFDLAAPYQARRASSLRVDGHSPRTSSLLQGSQPLNVNQKPSRYRASQDHIGDQEFASDDAGTSLSWKSRGLEATYSAPGNRTARAAAFDLEHEYVQDDFLSISEWRQYNRDRAEFQAQAQRRQLETRMDEIGEHDFNYNEPSNEQAAPSRHSRGQESMPHRPHPVIARRREDNPPARSFGRAQPEPIPRSQMVRTSKPREGSKDSASTQHPSRPREDGRDSSPPESPPPDPNGVIGHSVDDADGGQKLSKRAQEKLRTLRAEEAPRANPNSQSRHHTVVPVEKAKSPSIAASAIKNLFKEPERIVSKSTSKSSTRHRKDSDLSSRPAAERTKLHHDDERGSSRYSESGEEEAVTVRSNSKRHRDPEYYDRRRHK